MSMFKNKVAVITGGAMGIGKIIAEEFSRNGADTCIIDIKENDFFVGDISRKEVLESFSRKVIEKYGKVDFLINNALPKMKGIDNCSFEDFNYSLQV